MKTIGKWIKKHRKLCILLVICVIAGIAAFQFVSNARRAAQAMAGGANRQETAAVERRSLVESISATGQVVSAAGKTVTAQVTGVRAVSVPVRVGDVVEQGDLLCLFDTADLEDNLANSQLTLSVTKSKTQLDLKSAQRSLDEAETSIAVEQSRLVDEVESAGVDYEDAKGNMNQTGSSYNDASRNSAEIRTAMENCQAQLAKVNEKLSQLSSVSSGDASKAALEAEAKRLQQQITEYQTKYSAAQEAEKNLKSAYDQTVTAVNNTYDAYKKQMQSLEDSIRNGESTLQNKQDSLTTSKLNASTSGMSDQQQVDNYQEQIEACSVTAPLSGIVTAVNLEVDDMYNGGAIVTIEDVSSYEITVEIDEYDISKIKEGQRVVIKTNGTGDLELEGKVLSIAPRATAGSSVTYTVKTSIDTPCEDLRMDMTAKLSIVISSRENVLTVPYAAVQTAEDGSFYVEAVDTAAGVVLGGGQQGSANVEGGKRTDMELPAGAQAGGQDAAAFDVSGKPSMPGRTGSAAAATDAPLTRRIPVTKGIESDYYVEISGDGIEEGLEVIVPKEAGSEDLNTRMLRIGPMGGAR